MHDATIKINVKIDIPAEYPSDSTSYTSGDLLESTDHHVTEAWSHRSSSGLGSDAEIELENLNFENDDFEIDTGRSSSTCYEQQTVFDLPLKTLIKINRRTSKYKPIQIKIPAKRNIGLLL